MAPGGRVSYVWDKSTNNFLSHNVYSGNHAGRPTTDAGAILATPVFAGPGDTLPGPLGPQSYKLLYPISVNGAAAPGLPLADNGGRDFFGNLLPVFPAGAPTVGAHELGRPRGLLWNRQVRGRRFDATGNDKANTAPRSPVDARGRSVSNAREIVREAYKVPLPLFNVPE